MTTPTVDKVTEGGAADSGRAPAPPSAGWVDFAASVSLTLFLIGLLTVLMVLATLMPMFEHLYWPGLAKTWLNNIYGSYLFIGLFVVLAVNLLMCSVQQAERLLKREREQPTRVTRQDAARGASLRWRVPRGVGETAAELGAALRLGGYGVTELPGEEPEQRGLLARCGRLAPWAPLVVHVGMVIMLLGVAWGRWPSHTFRDVVSLPAGQPVPVKVGDEAFSLRLNDAGTERDAEGNPTEFWAKLDLLQEGQVLASAMVRPNHPLRYHGVSMVLQSLGGGEGGGHPAPDSAPAMEGRFSIEVTKDGATGSAPIPIDAEGQVTLKATTLKAPAWVVTVPRMRPHGEDGTGGPSAEVFVDRTGRLHTKWEQVDWVDEKGVDFGGAHLRLVQGEAGSAPTPMTMPPPASESGGVTATFSLDRDIGIPVVFTGFILTALGAILVLGSPRRRVTALVSTKGKGAQVLLSQSGRGADLDKLLGQFESKLGAVREAGSTPDEPAR